MRKIFLSKWFYIPAVIVVAVVIIVSLRNGKPAYELATAERGTLIQEVSITGSVTPIKSVDLSFERSGRIASVSVDAGDAVARGEVLLSLDTTSDQLDLKQAQATLAADQATLDKLIKGTRPEDLAVLESKYEAAQASLADTRQAFVDKLKDAFTKADDAVRNYADKLFDGPRSSSPKLSIIVNDDQLQNDLNQGRLSIESVLNTWGIAAQEFTENSDLKRYSQDVRTNLSGIALFLDKLAFAVNALTPSQSLSQATIDAYRSNVSTARSAVNTALSNITTGEDAYNTAVYALDLASKNLAVGRAGTVPEEIAAAQAKVLGDEAKIASIQLLIARGSIRAPFDGIVTKQNGKTGQVLGANMEVVSMIGDTGFEIEANVPEADIAKLAVGNDARVTLDAYGNDVEFPARVARIDPAETMIDNVATYKVTLHFVDDDARIRSGMTANVDVLSAEKPDVVLAPIRAVSDKDGSKVVHVMEGGEVVERQVITGLRGSNGDIEIVSGISEGEILVVGGL